MRQQIRLVISPAQIASVIAAIENSQKIDPSASAFLIYLRQKQFSISVGQTSVAYVTKDSRQSLGDSLGFDTGPAIANLNQVTPANIEEFINLILAGNMPANLTADDVKEINSFTTMMGHKLPADFHVLYPLAPPI